MGYRNVIWLFAGLCLLLVVGFPSSEAMALSQQSSKFKIVKDISYKTGETSYEKERCKLDLYLPADRTGFPVLVWFYGGGLKNNDKNTEQAVRIGRRFASEGVGTVVVDYRLSPQVKYAAYIEDAAAGVAWTIRHIGDYGGNARHVFVGGHSAGGYLTAMVVSDPRYLGAYNLSISRIAGAIPVSGQMDTHSTVKEERGIERSVQIIDEAAPLHYVGAGLPPMLILAGGEDMPGRSEINRRYWQELRAAGHQNAEFIEVPGRTHTSIVFRMDEPDDEVVKLMLQFISKL